MTEINESRVVKIRDKIVYLKDIRGLANLVAKEAESADSSERNWYEVSFTVDAFDSSSFQSSDPNLFSDDSSVTRRRVKKIDLSYREKAKNKRISISIEHGDRIYSNTITVSGSDSKWVNGTITQIEQLIASIKPQNTFVAKWGGAISAVAAISAGAIISFLFAKVMAFVPIHASSEPDGVFWLLLKHIASVPVGYYFIKYGLYYLSGLFPGFALVEKLKSLWPSVELQVGPEHEYIEKQRRLWVANGIVLGVIPLALSIFHDFVKSLGGS